MVNFILNGRQMSTAGELNLMEYLRDEQRLTSIKNGCGEGVCGACTILADGKAVRACTLTVAKVAGKKVVTLEGLSAREKETYAWAFAEAGAVQCGFCIPGMVMSSKALLDVNPHPGPAEVKKALKNNICRCTGYVKIEKAVLLAAAALRGEASPKHSNVSPHVGSRYQRVDACVKTLGQAQYVDDMHVEGMLYGGSLEDKVPPGPG